jgi:acetyl-CoA/propionyl-CoA carboxylase biotin carboxyl carrier protein
VRRDVDVEVNGKRFAVKVWVPESAAAPVAVASRRARPGLRGSGLARVGGSGQVTVPMQGTIVKVLVAVGDAVEAATRCACSRR